MSLSNVTMRGYGNGTFAGSRVVTLGYGLGEAAVVGPEQGQAGIEFRTEPLRAHFRTDPNRLHFRTENNRLHFRPEVQR